LTGPEEEKGEYAQARLHLVYEGQTVMDSSIRDKLASILDKGSNSQSKNRAVAFGNRELEILRLTAKGLTNKEIATALNVSGRTVQAHMVDIFRKTGASSRTQDGLFYMG
jgi:DNA-binding NarL/FixJ family response regulator